MQDIEPLVARYVDAASYHRVVTEAGDSEEANTHYDALVEVFHQLLSAGTDGNEALHALLDHQNLSVRVAAATHLLPTDADAARGVLEEAAVDPSLTGFST